MKTVGQIVRNTMVVMMLVVCSLSFLGTVNPANAQNSNNEPNDEFNIVPNTESNIINPENVGPTLGLVDAVLGFLPTLTFWALVIFVPVAIAIVVIKAVNPFTDDSEEKFSEGKKWFQNAGFILLAPVVLILVVILVYSLLHFSNPINLLRDPDKTPKLQEILPSNTDTNKGEACPAGTTRDPISLSCINVK